MRITDKTTIACLGNSFIVSHEGIDTVFSWGSEYDGFTGSQARSAAFLCVLKELRNIYVPYDKHATDPININMDSVTLEKGHKAI
jgi:hypothetical protein